MGAIRSGGIASGLDTNAIIDTLVTSAKEPITALENRSHLLSLQQTLFKDVQSDFNSLKNILFNLRLESTYKSKTASLSNGLVANVTASTEANAGTYTIDVLQKATQASHTSYLCKAGMVTAGAGVNTSAPIGEIPSKYNQQECDVKTTVTEITATSTWMATSEFKPLNTSTSYQKQTFSAGITSSLINANGDVNAGILSAGSTVQTVTFTHSGGITETVTFDMADYITRKDSNGNIVTNFENVNDINYVMNALEEAFNDAINAKFGTNDIQYVAFTAEFDGTSWLTAMYDVSGMDIEVDTSASSGNLVDEIGLGSGDPSSTSIVSTMTKYHVAADSAGLQAKLTSANGGPVYGLKINFTTLTQGEFEMRLDTTMNIKKAKPTVRTGTPVTSTPINVNNYPSTSFGLTDAETKALMGKITINGVTIDFSEYDNININYMMGIINGSGAGVTMTYDESECRFKLTSNVDGATAISLGSDSDTSTFFDVFCLSDAKGATTSYGSSEGVLNTSNVISEAGFTIPIGEGVFTINGVPIYIDPDVDTVNDLMRKVNNSGAGVTISYDSARDKFTVVANNSTDKITFGNPNDTSNFLYLAGFTGSPNNVQEMGNAGTEAIIVVDGQEYHRKTNTIDDVVGGLTITLASLGTTTVTVEVDTDKAVNQLTNFIATYNSIMTKLRYSEISEKQRDEYMTALTEEAKAGMSEKEIEKYQERYDEYHMQNLINNSSELKSVYKLSRTNIMSLLENNSSGFHNLTALGIDIAGDGDWTVTQKGLLVADSTDPDEIREALLGNSTLMSNLANKSEEVYQFFGGYEERSETDYEYALRLAQGDTNKTRKTDIVVKESWARRYEKLINDFLDVEGYIGLKTRTDSALVTQQQRLAKQIETLQLRAESYLERLWREFSAMETRVAAVQAQAEYISQLSASMATS